ncbi:MAG: type 1 glutamine amidotransferase domain-containing protein [Pseudomonadales bacterium]|nr:type 1 glutamine amidotransferase domain-containing protein [Pseudomonadales bacterium]NRA14794.1 type 1 glutamine amidotransferase domain-containing protein [Oceanospirillaceae bacterium]
MGKILILVTNHATLGSTDQPNGTYAPELTHALEHLLAADFEYDIASIKGGLAPLYGEEIEDGINERILSNDDFQTQIANTLPVSQLNSDDYSAVFYPGGFGLLSDLATDKTAAAITASVYDRGAIVGAVCHGPAGLLAVTLADGSSILKGKSVTGFTREEEIDFGTIEHIPFLLEEALTRNSGSYHKVAPWGEHVIVDQRLITGQNPASAAAVAKAMIKALQVT